MNPLSRTPVLSLLVPLLAGILMQYYFRIENWVILFFVLGIGLMLLSYFITLSRQYSLRWLFGVGLAFFVIGVGAISTFNRQLISENTFDSTRRIYKGVVTDIPQDKPRSVAYKTYLPDYNKKIVCYFQPDSAGTKLQPGDEFLFEASVQPFRNMEDSEFDYVTYMYDLGFSGSTYVPRTSWALTGKVDSSPKIMAQRCRQQILDFYRSLGFDDTEYSILAALTVGYQDAMSDDLKQSFRTTGTVHVLSVSGLHVGIIYLMIGFCLSFIHRSSRFYRIKPVVVIILLWGYAFITGLSPSVTRASLMLSAYCVAEVFNRKNDPFNALYIAAFFILLYNPFTFFHIGFQLSFLSVLSILYLLPKAENLIHVKNKYLRRIWQMFLLSCVAQLATFPLCLYYFGTFPTYFFVTNLLIVPLVTLIIYSFGLVVIAKLLSYVFFGFSDYLFIVPVEILKFLLKILVECVSFFENLPFALIEGAKISFLQFVLLVVAISTILICCIKKGLLVNESQKLKIP